MVSYASCEKRRYGSPFFCTAVSFIRRYDIRRYFVVKVRGDNSLSYPPLRRGKTIVQGHNSTFVLVCQEAKGQVGFSYEIALESSTVIKPYPTLFPLLPLLVYKERDESAAKYRLLSVYGKGRLVVVGGRKSRLVSISYGIALGKWDVGQRVAYPTSTGRDAGGTGFPHLPDILRPPTASSRMGIYAFCVAF